MGTHLSSLAVSSIVIAVLASAGAIPCQGGWKNLTGRSVPAIHVDKWLNTEKGDQPTSKSLKGKVWLLEFFATT